MFHETCEILHLSQLLTIIVTISLLFLGNLTEEHHKITLNCFEFLQLVLTLLEKF